MKRVFNVSAILIHDILQTTFPLSDAAVINEALAYESFQHDRLLQLIISVKLPVVVDSLMQGPNGVSTRFKSRLLGAHVVNEWLKELNATLTAGTRLSFAHCAMVHRPAAECRVHLRRRLASYAFIKIKLASYNLLLYV